MYMNKAIRICSALMVFAATTWAYPADQTSWLEKRVCQFVFHGGNPEAGTHNPGVGPLGIAQAAGALAHQAEVPICIESLPALSLETTDMITPIEINARDATVRDILEEMVRQDPRYEFRERLGVVEVLPVGADRDPTNCLNLVIPSFKGRYTWNTLIGELRIEVANLAKSAKDGWVRGGSALPRPPPGLIEANFENRTLRDILSMLCAKVGNMAWGAHFEGPRPTCENISFNMGQPKSWYPSDTVPLTWSEGLPKNCISCHYHQPCTSK
jgi:hypothetical protein